MGWVLIGSIEILEGVCFEVFFGVSSFNIAFQGMSGKVSRLFGILAASGVFRIKDL